MARGNRWSLLRQLGRPLQGRLLAGVCAGLARALVIDVTLVRLAFLLLGLASGLGLLLYLVLWILVPREDLGGHLSLREVVRDSLGGVGGDLRRATEAARAAWQRGADENDGDWPRPLSRRWIAIGLICTGLFVFLYSLGVFSWLGPGRTLGLVIVAIGAAVLFSSAPGLRRR